EIKEAAARRIAGIAGLPFVFSPSSDQDGRDRRPLTEGAGSDAAMLNQSLRQKERNDPGRGNEGIPSSSRRQSTRIRRSPRRSPSRVTPGGAGTSAASRS